LAKSMVVTVTHALRIDRRSPANGNWFLVFVFATCIAIPGLLSQGLGGGVGGESLVLQWIIVIWSGLRLSGIAAQGTARPGLTAFWVFGYVWLGLAGLLQVASGLHPWPIGVSVHALNLGQFAILIGFAFFE